MMSRIGSKCGWRLAVGGWRRKPLTENRSPNDAFTLIEVMVTVSVLSFGILLLYHSFFISVDSVQYASNRLNAQIWLDGKAWDEKDSFMRAKAIPIASDAGHFKLNGRDFSSQISAQLLEPGLYALTLVLTWKESGKERSLSYATYLILNEPIV